MRRLPEEVAQITSSVPDLPALAVCYARERGSTITAIPLDHENRRGDAAEWRATRLVELADAAVLVGETTEVCGLLERAAVKGMRLVAIGAQLPEEPKKAGPPREEARPRGLPD